MAWQTVKCAECEKEYRVQMYGKHSDRDYRVNNWAGMCDDCKTLKAEKAAQANAEQGYATLAGSPKQVAWAEQIRASMITRVKSNRELNTMEILMLNNLKVASIYIDCRNGSLDNVCREASRRIGQVSEEIINLPVDKRNVKIGELISNLG